MAKITATQKFNMVENDLAFMKKAYPIGKMTQEFADYKISVYEAIRLDLMKAMGEQVREYEDASR